jgi:hypothetical protein
MYAVRVLSLNNGWSILSNEKPNEWKGIQNALLELTPEMVLQPSKIPSLVGSNINDEIAAMYLPLIWTYVIRKHGWQESYASPKQEGGNRFRLSNVKNLVATTLISPNFINQDELSRIIFIDGPRSLSLGLCDVTVIIVPTDSVKDLYKTDDDLSSFAIMLSESECRINLHELSPIHNSSPIAIIFFSQEKELFVVDEIPTIQQQSAVERSIEFEPEYYQAGVGILSYFGEVLRQNYPNVNAKVRIEQDGNIVRMHVESPTGDIEIVERELEKYALVISNQAAPETLFENKAYIMRLEHKLEVTKLEVKQANDMLQLTRDLTSQRVNNLEQEVSTLRQQIGMQLLQTGQVIELATQQTASNERIQLAQIGHAHTLFKDLLGEAHGNQALQNAIRSLEFNLMSGIATIDVQEQIKESLSVMQQNNPNLLARFAAQVESAGYGALAGPVLEWLKEHAK